MGGSCDGREDSTRWLRPYFRVKTQKIDADL